MCGFDLVYHVSGTEIYDLSYVFNTDITRLLSTVGGVTTVYIAGVFEYQGGATTQYYDGNALRRSGYGIDDGVFYLLQDHLKSSSSFVNQSGDTLTNNYYYPYGGNRGGAFSNLTTKRFTACPEPVEGANTTKAACPAVRG